MGNKTQAAKARELLKQKRAERNPIEEQINAIASLPCMLYWSDGHSSKTTIMQSFDTEEDYKRYKEYKRRGQAYPVRIEPIEPTEEDKKKPSPIFPEGTVGGDYEPLKLMCQTYTEALGRYMDRKG